MTAIAGSIGTTKDAPARKPRGSRKTLAQRVAEIDKRLVKLLGRVSALRHEREELIAAAKAELAAATSSAEAGA